MQNTCGSLTHMKQHNRIYANSPGYRANLPLSRTADQNSRIKGSLHQLPTKNYGFKLHIFQNKFRNHLASYACITVSRFIFLCHARCSLQTKERDFLLRYSYIIESLIGWVFNHLKSLTERDPRFSREISWWDGGGGGGGGVAGSKNKLGIFLGGVALANSVGGCCSEKNFQIWDLQTLASLQQVLLQKICIPLQYRKPAASQISMSILFPREIRFKNKVTNWHSTHN